MVCEAWCRLWEEASGGAAWYVRKDGRRHGKRSSEQHAHMACILSNLAAVADRDAPEAHFEKFISSRAKRRMDDLLLQMWCNQIQSARFLLGSPYSYNKRLQLGNPFLGRIRAEKAQCLRKEDDGHDIPHR